MKISPYIHYNGDCEAALTFYKQCLGGYIAELNRYNGAPMHNIPSHYKDKILHCQFHFEESSFMACDIFPNAEIEKGNNIMLCISMDDPKKAKRIFNSLSKDGAITMPLEEQFWGALFGQLTDKFGISWMIDSTM